MKYKLYKKSFKRKLSHNWKVENIYIIYKCVYNVIHLDGGGLIIVKCSFVLDYRHPITSRRQSLLREVLRVVRVSPYLQLSRRQEDALRTKSGQHHPLAIKRSWVSILFFIEIQTFRKKKKKTIHYASLSPQNYIPSGHC